MVGSFQHTQIAGRQFRLLLMNRTEELTCDRLTQTIPGFGGALVVDSAPFAGSELGSWVQKYGWTDEGDTIFIRNQDESVKTKNIREKVDFETVAGLMAASK